MAASEQHMIALARANVIRLRRVEVKRKVKAGTLEVSGLLRAMPQELETMKVAELLSAQVRWGAHRTRRFLSAYAIGEHRQLGMLTERQREQLAWALHERRNGR